MILLLRLRRLLIDLVHLEVLVDDALEHFSALFAAVLGEDRVALGIGVLHPRAHHHGGLADALPVFNVALRRRRPAEVVAELLERLLHAGELARLVLGIEILDVAPAGDGQVDRVVAVDGHVVEIHAVFRPDHDEAVVAHLGDHAAQSDGVEAVVRQLRARQILLCHDEDHLFVLDRRLSGVLPVVFRLEIDIGVRHDQNVMNRKYCHVHASSGIGTRFIRVLTSGSKEWPSCEGPRFLDICKVYGRILA